MNVSELTKNLAEYSPTVNSAVDGIVSATRPMALVMIGVFFLIEIDSWYKYMHQEGGGLTQELWLQVAYKYLLAFMLVMLAAPIFDAILYLFNGVVHLVDGALPKGKVDINIEVKGVKGIIVKTMLNFIGDVTKGVVDISANLIVMMRAFQMYLLKALAPILISFWMADSTRPMAINLLKMFAAAALQGVLVIIVIRLYPALVTDDILKVASDKGGFMTAFVAIAKGIIFIFMLWGTQRVAKNLMGTS